MSLTHFYYLLRPIIPRRLQLFLRRRLTLRKRALYSHIWPIDPGSSTPPEEWSGWPEKKQFALVLQHDVDTQRGHDKCRYLMDLEESLGFRSSFNFVPERYNVSESLRDEIISRGFEVGVHGLKHDGRLFSSKRVFQQRAVEINRYLREWNSSGFTSPSMHHNLDWMHELNIEYDTSTFDTDPFEPQPDSVRTIFPFPVYNNVDASIPSNFHDVNEPNIPTSLPSEIFSQKNERSGFHRGQHSNIPIFHSLSFFLELPYTLPQDHSLFIIMKEKTNDIWKQKLDWIAEKGGMALVNIHPDYITFNESDRTDETYPKEYYIELLYYIRQRFEDQYWNALPREVARFYKSTMNQLNHSLPAWPRYPFTKNKKHTVWIDVDNSPHVPFFKPIIDELEKRGYRGVISARDCFQVCGLANLFKLRYRKIGRHYGKNKILKVLGTIYRALQLLPFAYREKPTIAVSHGSRSQLIASSILRIPVVLIFDYEYAKALPLITPTWTMAPEVIQSIGIVFDKKHLLRYPGIKEDVYVPAHQPEVGIREQFGISNEDILVTIRPPATEAHYHNPEAELLFVEVLEAIGKHQNSRMVILPRNEKRQTEWIKNNWLDWFQERKIIIPEHVVNGLDLMWHSDLVVSGGGTMNREAAALGVPVYTIFRGKIGAVDRYLSNEGRLTLLKSVEDVKTKITVEHRNKSREAFKGNRDALDTIVNHIVTILENV